MKKLLIAAGVIVGLLVLVAIALPFIFDGEKFRPMAESEAKKALGREVKIGKLGVSIWNMGAVAEDISVADDPAFGRDPFVTAKEMTIGVEILPFLTSKEVKITAVKLMDPHISLVKNAAGKWNFESLGAAAGSKKAPAPAPGALSIGSVKVVDGTIAVRKGSRKSEYTDVNVSVSNFSTTSNFPFELKLVPPGGGKVEANGNAGPLVAGNAIASPLNMDLDIKDLDLAKSGFVDPASGIGGLVDFSGHAQSNGEKLTAEGKGTAKKLKMTAGGAPATQPVTLDMAADLDPVTNQGKITKGDIIVGGSRAKLSGNINTKGETASVNSKLEAPNMKVDDIAGLLPALGITLPSGAQLHGGTASANLNIDGPLDRLVISGPLNVSGTTLSGFDLKKSMSAVAGLAGINIGKNIDIQTLATGMRYGPEGIRMDAIQLVAPSIGSMTGAGTISPSNALDFRMRAKLVGGGGLAGGLSALSSGGQNAGEIPFSIKGTTAAPIFVPDIGAVATGVLKAPAGIGQETIKGLGGLFGKKKKQ